MILMAEMEQRIVIARHGHWDPQSGELTDLGLKQARRLAERIRDFVEEKRLIPGYSLIISSEARRAREFAQALSQDLGIFYITHPVLGDEKGDFDPYKVSDQLKHLLDPIGGYKTLIAIVHRPHSGYLPIMLSRGMVFKPYEDLGIEGAAYGVNLSSALRGKNRVQSI